MLGVVVELGVHVVVDSQLTAAGDHRQLSDARILGQLVGVVEARGKIGCGDVIGLDPPAMGKFVIEEGKVVPENLVVGFHITAVVRCLQKIVNRRLYTSTGGDIRRDHSGDLHETFRDHEVEIEANFLVGVVLDDGVPPGYGSV